MKNMSKSHANYADEMESCRVIQFSTFEGVVNAG